MNTKSVIVIGAGIGGITAAAHLARRGLQITVVEKNARPGGRCDRFSREGHHFDTGPTLFLMPLLYDAEFRALGTSLSERLDLLRVDPTYHLVFDNGSQLALTSDLKSLQEQLESFQPGSFQGFLRYLQEGDRHYQLALDRLVNRDFRKASDFFSFQNVPLLFRLKPLTPHYRNMSAYFDDPRLKAAFTFQDSYMGLSPFEAPATFSLMPYSELAQGVWYPKGGMYREETFTPLSWRKRYNLVKGATHGLSHRLTQMAYFRPSNRHSLYHNLYFVGASTHPGTGIPTAMVSGRLVANRIWEELSGT